MPLVKSSPIGGLVPAWDAYSAISLPTSSRAFGKVPVRVASKLWATVGNVGTATTNDRAARTVVAGRRMAAAVVQSRQCNRVGCRRGDAKAPARTGRGVGRACCRPVASGPGHPEIPASPCLRHELVADRACTYHWGSSRRVPHCPAETPDWPPYRFLRTLRRPPPSPQRCTNSRTTCVVPKLGAGAPLASTTPCTSRSS